MTVNKKIHVHCNLQVFQKCGINTYQTEITQRLFQYDDIDVDPFYICFKILGEDGDFPRRRVRFPRHFVFYAHEVPTSRKPVSFLFDLIKPFVSFDSIIGGKSEDVFIFFDNTMTTMPVKGKTIALLHDIIPLRMAGVFKWEDFFRKNAKNVVKNATRIVTVSEYSKKDIVEVLHADPDKIDVVYNAVDPEIFSREKTSAEKFRALREKYGLPEKYILHFGSCLPQKNVPALIRAYSMMPDALKNEYRLVITNPEQVVETSEGKDDIRKIAAENGVSDYVVFPEKISDEDKIGMYQLASLMAWPSYLEGFGIPILEAQASGVPVVSSDSSSMPEVAGDSVVYFNPYDTDGMSQAMTKCLTDELLRSELVAKGYENLKRFSWDKSAKKFHDIITSLERKEIS